MLYLGQTGTWRMPLCLTTFCGAPELRGAAAVPRRRFQSALAERGCALTMAGWRARPRRAGVGADGGRHFFVRQAACLPCGSAYATVPALGPCMQTAGGRRGCGTGRAGPALAVASLQLPSDLRSPARPHRTGLLCFAVRRLFGDRAGLRARYSGCYYR